MQSTGSNNPQAPTGQVSFEIMSALTLLNIKSDVLLNEFAELKVICFSCLFLSNLIFVP